MQLNSQNNYQYTILNTSNNARIIILEYATISSSQITHGNQPNKKQNSQINIIKLVNLQGSSWPNFPLTFERKNYKTVHEVIRLNSSKLPVDLFIKQTLEQILKILKIMKGTCKQEVIPSFLDQQSENKQSSVSAFSRKINEIYISNYADRISFFVQSDSIEHNELIKNQDIKQLLNSNGFLSNLNEQKQKLIKTEMEYGSQSFVSFVQYNSLFSMLQLLCLHNSNQINSISQSLHAVTSILNYNHKFFHPPKDATRFLKKTCGVIIYGKTQIIQKKSKFSSQEVFLRCLFEIPPTKTLSTILGHPEGPIYLQKYTFSQNFVIKIQYIYYLGGIQTYFHKSNRRNFSYATFYSRINSQYLQSKKGKNWINLQRQKQIEFEDAQESDSSQDSQQQQHKPNQTDQYKLSYKQFVLSLKKQNQLRTVQYQKISKHFFTNENDEVQFALQIAQIDQFHKFILQISLTMCPMCMITLRNISFQQSSLQELHNMVRYGNDKYCIQCEDIYKGLVTNVYKPDKTSKNKYASSQSMSNKTQEQSLENTNAQSLCQSQRLAQKNKQTKQQQQKSIKEQNKRQINVNKASSVLMRKKQAFQNIQQKMSEESQRNQQDLQRKKPLRQVFLFQNYLPILILISRQMMIIQPDIVHDCFQLLKLRGFLNQLQDNFEGEGIFCQIISFYISNSIQKLLKVGNEANHYKISNLSKLTKDLKRKKYEIIEKNYIRRIIKEQFGIDQTTKNQSGQPSPLLQNILTIMQNELAITNAKITQHYRTYQQDMKKQYKVTVDQLKLLIQKIKADLKDKIIKTSEQFIMVIRWIMLIITEVVQEKSVKILKDSLSSNNESCLKFFTAQVQSLMNLCAMIIANCNQPGQAKIMQSIEQLLCQTIARITDKQNQIAVTYKYYISMSQKQTLKDMMEHFYYKHTSKIEKEQAKKLVKYHFDKFKTTFDHKLNTISFGSIQSYAKLDQKFKNLQLTILNSTIKVTDQILFAINEDTLFSAYIFLDQNYVKFQSNVVQNLEIRTFLNLIRSTTNLTWKQDSINLKSYPDNQGEKQQPQIIKIATVYKIICDSLQKSQTLQQFIKGFRVSNKRLFNLISYLISECYNFEKVEFWDIYNRVKLYLSRQMFYGAQKQHLDKHEQTLEIFKFLWQNRNKFLPYPNAEQPIAYFIRQYHFVICIVILNTLPLFNIQMIYKLDMKNLGKSLKAFSQNENYTQIQDYLIKVLKFRHNAAKQKRKQQLAAKEGGNKQDND